MGINLFTFDFSGCGNSEGEHVTLGWKETDDLRSVIEYLKNSGTVSKIAFWGRSMGAATSLLLQGALKADELPTYGASCLVLDSSFATLTLLIN